MTGLIEVFEKETIKALNHVDVKGLEKILVKKGFF